MGRMNVPPLRLALIGEFVGTALLVLLGDGVVASVALLNKEADWIVITTGWGLAVTLAVYLSGRLSGGHLNPAVTLALASRGDFPARRVVPYWCAQLLGAYVGAMLVYFDYAEAFADFERKNNVIRGMIQGPFAGGAGVFCTFPAFDDPMRNLFSEFLGTAVLLLCVRALGDPRNVSPPRWLAPALTGLVVWSIGLSLGGLTGYAINPARDLGPRVAASMLGWGASVFTSHGWYFWIPIIAPLAGGLAGAWLYDLAIAPNLPPPDEPSPAGRMNS
jgi:glycerol uptake facilitator protein